jgi:predicted nucleic acid-binding protein
MLQGWLRELRPVAISAFAWGEFLCGPLGEEEERTAHRIVQRLVPAGTREAAEAARLFNRGGRRSGSFPDCLIAATAILSGAELATSNGSDFVRFRDEGLDLAERAEGLYAPTSGAPVRP